MTNIVTQSVNSRLHKSPSSGEYFFCLYCASPVYMKYENTNTSDTGHNSRHFEQKKVHLLPYFEIKLI